METKMPVEKTQSSPSGPSKERRTSHAIPDKQPKKMPNAALRAARTMEAMAKMEELCDARVKIMEERQRALELELEEARVEIAKRLEREIELTKELKTFGDKFDEFREAVKTNESTYDTLHEELARARNEALSIEKAKLEAQLMKKKSDAALIELVEERNALRDRVVRLEKQNTSLEGLSRSLTERLKVDEEARG